MLYAVESFHPGEGQIYCDLVPADDEDHANDRIQWIRPYAVIANTQAVDEYVETLRRCINSTINTTEEEAENWLAEVAESEEDYEQSKE